MTETPPGRPPQPPTAPGSPAPAHGDGPTRPNAPTGPTGLRDRIAEALPCPVCPAQAGEPCHRAREDNQQPHMSRLLRADAVLPVIEAHIVLAHVDATQRADLLAGRLEQAERERDTAREALDAAAIVIASLRDQRDEQRQRAETAERRVEHFEEHAAQIDADLGIETQRAEVAESKVGQLRTMYDDLCRAMSRTGDRLAAAERERDEQRQRAETAERERDQALNAIADERRGRLAAQAAVRRLCQLIESYPPGSRFARSGAQALFRRTLDAEPPRDEATDLLREFVDDRPCTPHPGTGWCQTHAQRPPCPHAAAKNLLAALTIKQPKETP